MKNFLRVAFGVFILAFSATAYCSTIESGKAEQARVVVSPPEVQSADIAIVPFEYVTCVPFTVYELPNVTDIALDLCQTQTARKATLCPCTDIYLNSHRHTMFRRCELSATTGYKQHVKQLPYSRHVYTRC